MGQAPPKDDRCTYGTEEELMAPKAHGTCEHGPAATLRWNVPTDLADKICCFNRHSAENSGFWLDQKKHKFLTEVDKSGKEVIFYDSIFQKPIFIAPRNRTWEEFEKESTSHGWPSFRIEETNWEHVRLLDDGECVTVDGVHLGHNIPDSKGPRFCINLVCIAGNPPK